MANHEKIRKNLKKFGRFMLIVLNMSLNALLLKGGDSGGYDYYQLLASEEHAKPTVIRQEVSAQAGVAACA